MAICRWSDYKCDLYIYESSFGIECHVAARRYENEPQPPPLPTGDEAEWAAHWTAVRAYQIALRASPLVPIDHPLAGTGRTFDDWPDALAYVRSLREYGFLVPDWVIGDIEAEIGEAAGSSRPASEGEA